MPRIRTTKPEFYSDPELGRLSLEARYLYKGTWTFADDEGRLPADPRLLKSSVFPFDDKVSVRKVKNLIDEIVGLGKAIRYEVDGVQYLYLPNFARHQKINRPQPPKYPPPPGSLSERSSPGGEDSVSDHGTLTPPIRYEGIRRDHHHPGGGDDSVNDIVAGVERALLEEGVELQDLEPALAALRSELISGRRLESPVGWTRGAAEKRRQGRQKAMPPVEVEWCDACQGPIPALDWEGHVAWHEQQREAS